MTRSVTSPKLGPGARCSGCVSPTVTRPGSCSATTQPGRRSTTPASPWSRWVSASTGPSTPLAVEEGSTENATLAADLVTGLCDRGLDVTRPILAVLDGPSPVPRRSRTSFDKPLIQRCQQHYAALAIMPTWARGAHRLDHGSDEDPAPAGTSLILGGTHTSHLGDRFGPLSPACGRFHSCCLATTGPLLPGDGWSTCTQRNQEFLHCPAMRHVTGRHLLGEPGPEPIILGQFSANGLHSTPRPR
jgi:hypothetical protein